jgi:SAM-dependent methyltransferase
MKNHVRDMLVELRLIDDAAVEQFAPRVRDRADIQVLRCSRSGIIFLSSTDHVDEALYQNKDHLEPVSLHGRAVTTRPVDDDSRRARDFIRAIQGMRWLDVGAGAGTLIDLLGSAAASAAAVEPNRAMRAAIAARSIQVYPTIDAASAGHDVITLFHVLEHLVHPVRELAKLRDRLNPRGRLIAEVPHARDALLVRYDCRPFREFTLWSEHLILHTRESLVAVLRAAGFRQIDVHGVQRYSLDNHLHWLATGKPGGHELWRELADDGLKAAYEASLQRLDETDTLVAVASDG